MLNYLKSQLSETLENLERDWDHQNNDPSALVSLVRDVLNGVQEFSTSEIQDLLNEIKNNPSEHAKLQKHNLHELPTKIAETDKLIVELDVIRYNDPRVHGHQMSGGFKILKGHGVQAIYEFDESEVFNDILTSGELIKLREESLPQNSIVLISSENDFIHNVVYFETPVVTLTIRSKVSAFPMLYLPNGFRINVKKFDTDLMKLADDLKARSSQNALKPKLYDTETLIILNYLAASWTDVDEAIRSYLYVEIAGNPWSNTFLSALTQNSIIHQRT